MKLNTDMSRMWRKETSSCPTKRSMNLYFKVDRGTAPATAALYILFALVLVAALSKVLFYDPLNTVKQLEAQLLVLEEQAGFKQNQLKDYNKVLEEYTRTAPTEEELSLVDRMQILSLIDSTIRPKAKISQVSISENKVLISFTGVSLKEAAALVSQLEQSPLVSNTSVDTAVSTRENQHIVEIHVYFEVTREEKTHL